MGAALWLAAGVAAFLTARIIPLRRTRRFVPELVAAIAISVLLGVVATVLDFGGWNEADWRAITFALLGSLACIGAMRAWQR